MWAPLPQKAQAGEHTACTAAVELLDGPSTLYGDCKDVVDDAHLPAKRALNHRRMHAAASTLERSFASCSFVMEDVKVKSHVKTEAVSNLIDKWKATANTTADLRGRSQEHPSGGIWARASTSGKHAQIATPHRACHRRGCCDFLGQGQGSGPACPLAAQCAGPRVPSRTPCRA